MIFIGAVGPASVIGIYSKTTKPQIQSTKSHFESGILKSTDSSNLNQAWWENQPNLSINTALMSKLQFACDWFGCRFQID
jgi:hypothetical protein